MWSLHTWEHFCMCPYNFWRKLMISAFSFIMNWGYDLSMREGGDRIRPVFLPGKMGSYSNLFETLGIMKILNYITISLKDLCRSNWVYRPRNFLIVHVDFRPCNLKRNGWCLYLVLICFSQFGRFTVNPRRRIRQHNGEIGSGASRTKSRRPWEMVFCIYGFPTHVSALQVTLSVTFSLTSYLKLALLQLRVCNWNFWVFFYSNPFFK